MNGLVKEYTNQSKKKRRTNIICKILPHALAASFMAMIVNPNVQMVDSNEMDALVANEFVPDKTLETEIETEVSEARLRMSELFQITTIPLHDFIDHNSYLPRGSYDVAYKISALPSTNNPSKLQIQIIDASIGDTATHAQMAQPAAPQQQAWSQNSTMLIQQQDYRVDYLLERANAALAAKKLTIPSHDNAVLWTEHVLAIQPNNQQARTLLSQVVQRYVDWMNTTLTKGEAYKAQSYLTRVTPLQQYATPQQSQQLSDLGVQVRTAVTHAPPLRKRTVKRTAKRNNRNSNPGIFTDLSLRDRNDLNLN